jgi:hypothetical protein
MPQRIDLDKAYGRARRRVLEMTIDGHPPLPLAENCLFTFDQLLNERGSALEAILANAQPAVP